MSQSDSLWLTLALLQYHTKLTARWLWQWLIQHLFVWLSVMLAGCCLSLVMQFLNGHDSGFCSVGSTPTSHLMSWFCTSSEASTYQLPQVLKAGLHLWNNQAVMCQMYVHSHLPLCLQVSLLTIWMPVWSLNFLFPARYESFTLSG